MLNTANLETRLGESHCRSYQSSQPVDPARIAPCGVGQLCLRREKLDKLIDENKHHR